MQYQVLDERRKADKVYTLVCEVETGRIAIQIYKLVEDGRRLKSFVYPENSRLFVQSFDDVPRWEENYAI